MVNPKIWNDPEFVQISDAAKIIWLWFLTIDSPMPGLHLTGVGGIARELGFDDEKTSSAFEEIVKLDWLRVDDRYRMILIPNALCYSPQPGNPNVLKGWWRRWLKLPESSLKYDFIVYLRDKIKSKSEKYIKVWNETFGTVKERKQSNKSLTFAEVMGDLVDSSKTNESYLERHLESALKANPPKNVDVVENKENGTNKGLSLKDLPKDLPKSVISISTSSSVSSSGSTSSSGSEPADRIQAKIDYQADELWSFQERFRDRLGCGMSLPFDAQAKKRVMNALSEFKYDVLRHVISVYANDVQKNRDTAKYFNGVTNWKPENIRRAMGMPGMPDEKPAVNPMDPEKKAAMLKGFKAFCEYEKRNQ